ncbi:MAG: M56 family metallopeptidase [Gemmatimonadota bacterium]|nr:M56 family metallopeptidase [Gemmatimonadota bacterium]
MNTLIHLAETWWPLYAVHMVEVSLFILLVWAVDRWLTLETRLRYALYLLALAKVFVPPVLAIPIPAFLVSPATVVLDEPVYSGVVSGAVAVSPEPVTTFPPAFYLFCLWTLSVLVWTGVALWKNAAFRRTLRSANPVDLASEIPSMNAPRNLEVFSKTDLPSPVLVGLTRPRLILPSKWASWTPEELRGVVRHELAHFEKRDIHVLILQGMATALFGANPLIWLLNRRLIYLRELRCDEAVLRETRLTPAEYGRLLLGLVDRRPTPRALTVFFTDRGTSLKKRLEHVLSYQEGRIKPSKWHLAALVLVGLMIVPLSIREAYTQDERATAALDSFRGGRGSELNQVQHTAPPVTGNSDTIAVGVSTGDEAEVETRPITVGQQKSTVIISDIVARFANSDMAPEADFDVTVTLKVQAYAADGSVCDMKVLNAEGPAGFKNAVIDSVSRVRFEPAKPDSENATVWFTQEISYYNYPSRKKLQTPDSTNFRDTALAGILASDQTESKPKPIRVVTPEYPRAAHKEKLESVDDANVLEFWSADVKPVLIHSVAPVYPDEAKTEGLSGNVFLKFKVNVDGSVSAIRVLRGKDIFHKPAIDAIAQFRFTPAEREGKPVAVWMTKAIKFKLPDQKAAPPSDRSDVGGEKAFEISDVDVMPVLLNLNDIRPAYPDIAKKAGLTGRVILKFKINVDGSVNDVNVLEGDEIFRKPAIDAVHKFKYKPAELDGKPVAVWMTLPFRFAIPEDQEDSVPETGEPGIGN